MSITVYIIMGLYAGLIFYLRVGWSRACAQGSSSSSAGSGRALTLLIPFRNERDNLPLLLRDIYAMPTTGLDLRIVLIDDHSEDDGQLRMSELIAGRSDTTLCTSQGAGKKAALMTGMAQVQTEYLLTLDADVRLPKGWSSQVAAQLQRGLDMVILPVMGTTGDSLASRYALIDFISLIGSTYAMAAWDRPVMANGAQLLIRTERVQWRQELTSGDDVFALHHIKASGGSIGYALHPDLVASTAMPESWGELWQQRLRWASKAKAYRDTDTLLLGWAILAVNVLLWVLFFRACSGAEAFYLFLSMFASKFVLDLLFLWPVSRWYGRSQALWSFPLAALLNWLQYPLVFIGSTLGGFHWKGRRFTR